MRIGILPTTTSVVFRPEDGSPAETLPEATEKAAGCMTPRHVRDLKSLIAWRVGIEAGVLQVVPDNREGLSTLKGEVAALKAALANRPEPVPLPPIQMPAMPSEDTSQLRSGFQALTDAVQALATRQVELERSRVSELTALVDWQQDVERRLREVEAVMSIIAVNASALSQEGAAA